MIQQECYRQEKDKIPSGILIQAKQSTRGCEEVTEELLTGVLLFR